MGTIVKPDRGVDFYVLWSDIVEAPTAWGSAKELEEGWRNVGSHEGPWQLGRIQRADRMGTSALWPTPHDPAYGWNDHGFIYMQRGWLKRERLVEACARLGADENADIGELLVPLEGLDEVRPA